MRSMGRRYVPDREWKDFQGDQEFPFQRFAALHAEQSRGDRISGSARGNRGWWSCCRSADQGELQLYFAVGRGVTHLENNGAASRKRCGPLHFSTRVFRRALLMRPAHPLDVRLRYRIRSGYLRRLSTTRLHLLLRRATPASQCPGKHSKARRQMRWICRSVPTDRMDGLALQTRG